MHRATPYVPVSVVARVVPLAVASVALAGLAPFLPTWFADQIGGLYSFSLPSFSSEDLLPEVG